MGRDAITGLVVLAASLVLFWATLGLQKHPLVPIGPDFYPKLVLGVTAVLAALLVVRDLIARRRARTAPPVAPAAAARPNYPLVLAAFGIFAVYVAAIPYLGFRVATLIFLVAMQAALDRPRSARRWIAAGLLAIATTVATYYVFEAYLHVLLPRGRWTGF